MRILTYDVTPADDGRAIRTVVPRRFSLGNHAFRRLKVLGAIRVAGAPVRADYIVHAGERIEVHLPDDMAADAKADSTACLPDLPPSYIRYMDEDIIIAAKGATFNAVSVTVCYIVKALLSSIDTTMTVSTMLNGEYGIDDVCMSVLNVVNNQGAHSKLLLPLTDNEVKQLRHSAECLKNVIKSIKI